MKISSIDAVNKKQITRKHLMFECQWPRQVMQLVFIYLIIFIRLERSIGRMLANENLFVGFGKFVKIYSRYFL